MLDIGCIPKVKLMLGKDMREATVLYCESFFPLLGKRRAEMKAASRTICLCLVSAAPNNMLLNLLINYLDGYSNRPYLSVLTDLTHTQPSSSTFWGFFGRTSCSLPLSFTKPSFPLVDCFLPSCSVQRTWLYP